MISADRLILLGDRRARSRSALWVLYRYTKFGLGDHARSPRTSAPPRRSGCRPTDRRAQLGARLRPRRPRRDPDRPDRHAAAGGPHQPRARRDRRGARRRLPLVPDRARRRHRRSASPRPRSTRYVRTAPASAPRCPFVLIVVWLVVRGQALPLRDYLLQRLPTIGSGRIHKAGHRVRRRASASSCCRSPTPIWIDAFTVTLCVARRSCCRSSCSPATPASCRSPSSRSPASAPGSPGGSAGDHRTCRSGSACIIGIVATIPLGVLFALPAVRTRGHQPRDRHARARAARSS